MVKRKGYLKISLNILTVLIIIAVIIAICTSIFGAKNYNYRLDLSKITLYSDENILEKINQVKDSNTIVIVFDNSNKNYSLGSAMLNIQIFSSQHKRILFFIEAADNNCVNSDSNTLQVTSTTVEKCEATLSNLEYPIIRLGKLTNSEKTEIIINKNEFNVLATSAETSFNENHNFLEVLYPNILEIEQAIQNIVGKLSDKLE